jgi:hypothetical protein
MPAHELQRRSGLSASTYVVIVSTVGTAILVSPGDGWAVPRAGLPPCASRLYGRALLHGCLRVIQWPKPSVVSPARILSGVPVYYVWSSVRRPRTHDGAMNAPGCPTGGFFRGWCNNGYVQGVFLCESGGVTLRPATLCNQTPMRRS